MTNPIDWRNIFTPDASPIEIILRGTVMYLILFILLRVILKRQSGTLGMTDLLLVTLLADASQNAMAGDYLPAGRNYTCGNAHLLEFLRLIGSVLSRLF